MPKHFKKIDGVKWLEKDRHKNYLKKKKTKIRVPIIPQLEKILDQIPTPLDQNQPLFPDLYHRAISQNVRAYFTRAGLKGYGAKYLRRYMGESALELGQSKDWIGQALAHCDHSTVTNRYMRVRDAKMLEVFEKIAGNEGI